MQVCLTVPYEPYMPDMTPKPGLHIKGESRSQLALCQVGETSQSEHSDGVPCHMLSLHPVVLPGLPATGPHSRAL